MEEDFAALFEASLKAKQYQKGQVIDGRVVAIGADVAFVDVGGKGEAQIDVDELKNADGVLEVAVGDRIQATVVSTGGGLTLSRTLLRGAATDRQLTDAYQSGLAVEGKVEREIKGGYEVRVGGQRAFCPMSQIDIVRTTNPADHVGRVYPFRIVEHKDGGRNLVLSRRALLEQAQQAVAADVRRTIVSGAVLKGRVVSVRDFGAFVDLGGGVQGLLHVSEMGWSRVSDPSTVVSPGQEITVQVLRVDEATQKIALSVKPLIDDPWTRVPTEYAVGQVRPGRVTRIADFGAFVEFEPGVEALAHASSFAPTGRPGGWSKQLSVGSTTDFEILNIDVEKRRIGVAPIADGSRAGATSPSSPSSRIEPGARVAGKIERHEKFGVFVYLAPGVVGLMPLSETGVTKDADVAKTFPVGSDVDVIVLEVDAASRRVRVSRKAVQDAHEAAELREYKAREESSSTQGMGTLADKLRSALGPK